MAKFKATKALFYTSKDSVPAGAIFDPESISLTADAVKTLIAGGYISPEAASDTITYPAAAAESAAVLFPKKANELIVFISTVTSPELLAEIAANEERPTVKTALNKRSEELLAEIDLKSILDKVEAASDQTELDTLADGETREVVLKAIEAKSTALVG